MKQRGVLGCYAINIYLSDLSHNSMRCEFSLNIVLVQNV